MTFLCPASSSSCSYYHCCFNGHMHQGESLSSAAKVTQYGESKKMPKNETHNRHVCRLLPQKKCCSISTWWGHHLHTSSQTRFGHLSRHQSQNRLLTPCCASFYRSVCVCVFVASVGGTCMIVASQHVYVCHIETIKF